MARSTHPSAGTLLYLGIVLMLSACGSPAPVERPGHAEPPLALHYDPPTEPRRSQLHMLLRLDNGPTRSLRVTSETRVTAGPAAPAIETRSRILHLAAGGQQVVERAPRNMVVTARWNGQHRQVGAPTIHYGETDDSAAPETAPTKPATTKPATTKPATTKPATTKRTAGIHLAEALGLSLRVEYPTLPVRVGETWKPNTTDISILGFGRMQVRAAFTLSAHDKGSAQAQIRADYRLSAPRRILASKLVRDGEGGATAWYTIDANTGQVLMSHGRLAVVHSIRSLSGKSRPGAAVAQQQLDATWAVSDAAQPVRADPLPRAPTAAPECEAQLAALQQEALALPQWKHGVLGLRTERQGKLPRVRPGAASRTIDEPGPVLVVDTDGPIAFDGRPLSNADARAALAELQGGHIYLVAPAVTRARALARWLQPLPAAVTIRTVVEHPGVGEPPRPRWLARSLASMVTGQSQRRSNTAAALPRLLSGLLAFCPAAKAAATQTRTRASRKAAVSLAAAVQACGCRRAPVASIRRVVADLSGSPQLRYQTLQRPWQPRGTLLGALNRQM